MIYYSKQTMSILSKKNKYAVFSDSKRIGIHTTRSD